MFDRYYTQNGPSSMSVSVTEKRAPTDESVRLLREMEAAARKDVTNRLVLDNNEFKCQIVRNPIRYTTDIFYMLNGTRHCVSVNDLQFTSLDMVDAFVEALAKHLAVEILKPAFTKSNMQGWL